MTACTQLKLHPVEAAVEKETSFKSYTDLYLLPTAIKIDYGIEKG